MCFLYYKIQVLGNHFVFALKSNTWFHSTVLKSIILNQCKRLVPNIICSSICESVNAHVIGQVHKMEKILVDWENLNLSTDTQREMSAQDEASSSYIFYDTQIRKVFLQDANSCLHNDLPIQIVRIGFISQQFSTIINNFEQESLHILRFF